MDLTLFWLKNNQANNQLILPTKSKNPSPTIIGLSDEFIYVTWPNPTYDNKSKNPSPTIIGLSDEFIYVTWPNPTYDHP